MTLRSVRPLGTFQPVMTKDAEALSRDGQTYVLVNDLAAEPNGTPVVEIMFEDGIWILATPADLVDSLG